MIDMRNFALKGAGLALGAVNTVRHRLLGYRHPRPYDLADIDRNIHHGEEVVEALGERGELDWRGKRVLEIGPGSDLTTGALLLHRGATRYVAVDAFDNRASAHPDHYAELGRRLGSEVPVSELGFVQATFPGLPELTERFDVVISNATLEHIEDIPALFRRLHELVEPGGRMVHHVGAQAHMRWFDTNDPLNMLRYSDRVYRRVLSFPGAPNRLRAGDFVDAATAGGWKDPKLIPVLQADADYLEATTPALAKRFRDRDDVGLLTFTLVCDA